MFLAVTAQALGIFLMDQMLCANEKAFG